MSTSAMTRKEVLFYTITKKRMENISNSEEKIKETFKSLTKARIRSSYLSRNRNFVKLENSNGVLLPLTR